MTAARHNADHLARNGLVAPVRFVGYTDTAIDDDGNFIECPQSGKCCLCGEGLRYVFHFVDANGVAFDAGSDCAKWARLSPEEKKAVAKAKREAAELAKAERNDPGYIARQRAAKAERDAKSQAEGLTLLADHREKQATLAAKVERAAARLVKATEAGDEDTAELIADALPRLREELARLDEIVSMLAARHE